MLRTRANFLQFVASSAADLRFLAVASLVDLGAGWLQRRSLCVSAPTALDGTNLRANGELIAHTNALNQSTRYGLDPLRRIAALTDAASATATLAYDAQDQVIQARDFKGVATRYARELGQPIQERSADIGVLSTRYDPLGLPRVVTDALGQATTLSRDLLGRPVQLSFADGKSTTLRYDASSTSRGYLASSPTPAAPPATPAMPSGASPPSARVWSADWCNR